MGGIAVIASSLAVVHTLTNTDVTALELVVTEPGLYLVFARLVIDNTDSDSQNATAKVVHQGDSAGELFVIDRADVVIPGKHRYSISLQGTLQVLAGKTKFLFLIGNAFNCNASQSSIFCVQVSEFKFS